MQTESSHVTLPTGSGGFGGTPQPVVVAIRDTSDFLGPLMILLYHYCRGGGSSYPGVSR